MLLSDNKHENLISLVGFCDEKKEKIIVCEYAHNRSLDWHLEHSDFTWVARLKICLGAARGLKYLHKPRQSQRVLHCDIKSANILLDDNWNAKIADFGFSIYGPATSNRSYHTTQVKGTVGYVDPVFMETHNYTTESDVYSFGVVLLEVLCSRLCVDNQYNDRRRSLVALVKNYSKEEIRDNFVKDNLRQQTTEDSFDMVLKLALQCVESEEIKKRPSMNVIVKTLEAALKDQEQHEEKHRRFSKLKAASGFMGGLVLSVVLVGLVLL